MIAPIRTEPGGRAWAQSTFEPFAQIAAAARGDVLRVEPQVATYATEFGDVPLLDATATFDDETGRTSLFLVNRSDRSAAQVRVDAEGFPGAVPVGRVELSLPPLSWQVVRLPDLGQTSR